MSNPIPTPIIEAAAGMLMPYGVNLPELLSDHAPQPIKPLEKAWLTNAEAEIYSGLRRWTLWRASRAGKIIASKPGQGKRAGRILFDRVSIDKWLESCRVAPKASNE